MKIYWTEKAKNDLRGIFDYISYDSIFYAKRYVKAIKGRTDILRSNPNAGRKIDGLGELFPDLRELIFRNHRIIYKVAEQQMTVLRVHHSKKNFSYEDLS